MFQDLKSHLNILVSGPQRSGTRICAKMVAADTGLHYIDETDIPQLFTGKSPQEQDQDWDEIGNHVSQIVQGMVDTRSFVLHCPPLMPWIHKIKNALIIITWRPVDEILRSADRINWRKSRQEFEYNKMGYTRFGKAMPGRPKTFKPLAELKYEYFEKFQQPQLDKYLAVDYHSLRKHQLWVPTEERKHFLWNQTAK